ncbi:MAG TPA: hypothetical protein VHE11_15490 [Steroidobacteraceae bacterium]|nr:hypothetical protein [Steroidobacteraceae bacterium]
MTHAAAPSTGEARLVRLVPVSVADAQAAYTSADGVFFDDEAKSALEMAGLVLDASADDSAAGFVWVRFDDRPPEEPQRLAVSFYRVEVADPRRAAQTQHWVVEAYCWRRGPDGSIALYGVCTQRAFERVFETDFETIGDETAAAVARSIVDQMAEELYPLLLQAVRATQGLDPDKPTDRNRLA